MTGEPNIRFYAGAVLHGPTGQPLGTLCLIDSQARALSQTERGRLRAFGKLIEQEINLNARVEDLRNTLHRTAFYDAVTGLAKRSLVEEHLERMVGEAREQQHIVAVMHLHILNLEETIAVHGSATGNAYLKTIAARLQAVTDTGDIVGRHSADRFLFILSGLRSRAESSARVGQIMQSMSRPLKLNDTLWQVKLSAGISSYPDDADSVEALLERAQIALHRTSTESERLAYQFYSRDIHSWVSRRHSQAQRLTAAIKNDDLEQVYQPIVALNTGRITSVEALARWTDERFGFVSPAEFIPLTEEDRDMCRAMTQWALRTACRQALRWREQLGVWMRVGVNIPGSELCREDFVDFVKTTLRQSGLPAEQLTLELTEQSLIANLDAGIAAMHSLRAAGIHFAVDDFGTGYSSLSYLRKLPLDALKIDRSFIIDVATDAVARDLTKGIYRNCQRPRAERHRRGDRRRVPA